MTCDLHNYDKLSRVYFKDYKSISLSINLSKYSLFICSFTYWLNFNRVTCDLHNYDKLSRVYLKDYKSISLSVSLSKYSFDHLASYSFICSFTY